MPTITKFMVVAKERETRSAVQKLLESMGYNLISPLEDSQEALSQVEQKGIQLIIIDWDVKPLPATVFLQKMRSKAKFRHNPTVVLAKKMVIQDLRLSTELGIEQILPLPLDPQKTKAVLKKMIDSEESLPESQVKLRQAADRMSDGDLDGALKLVSECHVMTPDALEPCRLLAEILVTQKKWVDAEFILGKAVRLAPKHSFLAQLLSKVYANTGRHAAAVQLLVQMVQHSPLNIGNFLGLGSAYALSGDDANAKGALEQAVRLDATNTEAQEGLGKLAFRAGDFEAAKDYFANTDKGGELAREFNNVGIGLVAAGNTDNAIQSYRAALTILEGNEAHSQVLYNLGLALKKKGLGKEAFRALAESYLKGFRAEKVYAGILRLASELKGADEAFDADLLHQVMDAKKGQKASA